MNTFHWLYLVVHDFFGRHAVSASGISAVVAAVSLLLNFLVARRAAKSGQDQAFNARISAQAAEKSADATTKGVLDAQRAFLIPENFKPQTVDRDRSAQIIFNVDIRNIGKTVAFNVIVTSSIMHILRDMPDELSVAPARPFHQVHLLPTDSPLAAHEARLTVPRTPPLRIVSTIVVRFTDIFKDEWKFQWCYAFELMGEWDYKPVYLPHLTELIKESYSLTAINDLH